MYTRKMPPVAAITPILNLGVARTMPDVYSISMTAVTANVRPAA